MQSRIATTQEVWRTQSINVVLENYDKELQRIMSLRHPRTVPPNPPVSAAQAAELCAAASEACAQSIIALQGPVRRRLGLPEPTPLPEPDLEFYDWKVGGM